LRAAYEQVLY